MSFWLLVWILSFSLVQAAELVKIPLTQRSILQPSELVKRSTIGYAPLMDDVGFGDNVYVDYGYLGEVDIGNPPQTFHLQIDSGSGILWVTDIDCRGCNVSNAHLFDPNASHTSIATGGTLELAYAKGGVECAGFNDTVSFGGITMENFTFGSCYNEIDVHFPESIGILGIGFPDHEAPGQNWITEAYHRSLIPAPVYSLVLGRYQPTDLTVGSLLVIGGYDEDLVSGPLTWVECSGSQHAQIPLDAIIVNGQTISRVDDRPMQAIIDSGTGGIIPGPRSVVNAIYESIGAVQASDQSGFWVFPCDQAPSIGFQFGGQIFMMDPEDFVLSKDQGQCIGALMGMDLIDDNFEESAFLLGVPFMKNVVTVFDLGTPAVGFGHLNESGLQYGSATVVPDTQRTAMGTGPSASLSPTFTGPVFTDITETTTISTVSYDVQVISGTNAITVNDDGMPHPTGISTSAGATVIATSKVPTAYGTSTAAAKSGSAISTKHNSLLLMIMGIATAITIRAVI